ncbi:DNA/RNA non-specific endonuclease (plasmid) [Aeromonas media]|uniref:Endonuclease n=1 Tax=Aeromonas media TaxID=651 RepID=A0ABX6NXV1_AERME|nr:DNA/RNA non-specific endonuclease [Aeromonas media]
MLISEVNKTALYAAEKLTPARMKGAKKIKRGANEFFEDYRLPEEVRVSTYSYSHTGYDRGHLAPAGDFSTLGAQRESFSLANVVPQSSTVNRGIWADIESTVRHLAEKGTTHVVTGPLYLGPTTYLPKGGSLFRATSSRRFMPRHRMSSGFMWLVMQVTNGLPS